MIRAGGWWPRPIFVTLACTALFATAAPSRVGAAICPEDTVANDSIVGNYAHGPSFGRAIGQVFYTTDTLLTSITVWVAGTDGSLIGMHLFLFSTDANGQPNTDDLLLDGPTLTFPFPPDTNHSTPVVFAFEPPVVLPRAGQYAMAFQAPRCYLGAPFYLRSDTANHYPYGWFWESERSDFYPDCPIYSPQRTYYVDLCFRATFCKDAVTATRRETWGRLKLHYR